MDVLPDTVSWMHHVISVFPSETGSRAEQCIPCTAFAVDIDIPGIHSLYEQPLRVYSVGASLDRLGNAAQRVTTFKRERREKSITPTQPHKADSGAARTSRGRSQKVKQCASPQRRTSL